MFSSFFKYDFEVFVANKLISRSSRILSTLLFIKSKSLLPKQVEDEAELTEEELVHRIIEYKKYIVVFVLIVIIYFILSLNPVKNAFGMILTCINPDDNGYVSYGGYLAYGVVIGLIVCICNYLVDRFLITYWFINHWLIKQNDIKMNFI